MLEHWLWLAHRNGLKERTKLDLLLHFGSPEMVYTAQEQALSEIDGLTSEALEALEDKSLELYREAVTACEKDQIRIVTYSDAAYPKRLKNIYDPPLLLYCRGELPDLDALPVIGIVGTRKPSAYGLSAARRIGAEIAGSGGVVVSGLASGVDSAAMSGALTAGGCAIGVLGCGADVIYPKSNQSLFDSTVRYGCVLSEFLPGTEPFRWNFPKRNRIISGLSCGVLVVEAPEKSGSLITARFALEQGRDVYAVPGNIDMPGFTGSNRLLREGAGAVSCGWDIMSEYQSQFPDKIRKEQTAGKTRELPEAERVVAQKPSLPRKKTPAKQESKKKDIDNGASSPYIDLKTYLQGLSASEQAIVAAIGAGERLVDDVIAETGISSGKVLCALTMLELKRIIVRLPGKRVALRQK